MILNYNECKIVNVVWIERGILITIIYYILKKYKILLDKILIIDNKRYCKFLKIIFPELKFKTFKKHSSNNFYFNIRKIIKNQDIIIDYLANYTDIINTDKISLLPWYDMNDPIIIYEYKSDNKIKVKKYKLFINNFSQCQRGNYNNNIWDTFIELLILQKYAKFNRNINYYYFFNMINNFLKSTYTDTVQKPKIYYINNPVQNIDNKSIDNKSIDNKIIDTDNKTIKNKDIITVEQVESLLNKDFERSDILTEVCKISFDILEKNKVVIKTMINLLLINKIKKFLEPENVDINDYLKQQISNLTIGQELISSLDSSKEKGKIEILKKIYRMNEFYNDLLTTLLDNESIKKIATFLTLLQKEKNLLYS